MHHRATPEPQRGRREARPQCTKGSDAMSWKPREGHFSYFMAGIPKEELFAFLIFQTVTLLSTLTKYRTSNAWVKTGGSARIREFAGLAQARPSLVRGNSRTRFPVAAKTALHSAGVNGGTPGSPIPAGGASLSTRCTCVSRGAEFIRVKG